MELQQPWMRKDYVANMGGVDTADQQNGSHAHDHKACTNYWRRVMEAKIEQTFTNIFVMFKALVAFWDGEAKERLERGDLDLESSMELEGVVKELRRLANLERSDWDEQMSTELMGRCGVGSLNKGGRQVKDTEPPKDVWGSVHIKTKRKCMYPGCKKTTRKGCACEAFCGAGREGGGGVLMCKGCFENPARHARAARAEREASKFGKRTRKDMNWCS